MYQKQLSIRRSIRYDQLNAIKTNIRANLILSNQQQLQLAQKRQAVEQYIQKDDLAALIEVFGQSNENLMLELSQPISLQCFSYLKTKIDDVRGLSLLKNLIQHHFVAIFDNDSMAEQNKLFLDQLYERADKQIQKLVSSSINHNGALSQYLSGLLQILSEIYFRISHQRVSRRQNLRKFDKSQNIVKYIFAWLPHLLKNEHYLSILTTIISHSEIFGVYNQYFAICTSNLQFFDALVTNIRNYEDRRSQCSFSLLRNLFQNCFLNEQFVIAIINDYWFIVIQKLKENYNKKPSSLTHNLLFEGFQSLDRLLLVLSSNSCRKVGTSFLFTSDYYQFLFKLLQYQSQKYREALYLIIYKSIEILEANKQTLLDYIRIQAFNQIIADLTNNMSHRLTIIVMKIIYRLIRSTHMPCDTYELLMNYFLENGVVYVLEILQFHKNRQIALIASDLLENQFKQHSYQEMQVEGSSGLWQQSRNGVV